MVKLETKYATTLVRYSNSIIQMKIA